MNTDADDDAELLRIEELAADGLLPNSERPFRYVLWLAYSANPLRCWQRLSQFDRQAVAAQLAIRDAVLVAPEWTEKAEEEFMQARERLRALLKIPFAE